MKRSADNAFGTSGPLITYEAAAPAVEIQETDDQKDCLFKYLPGETLDLILDNLRHRHVINFGMTCKQYLKRIEDVPMWEKLCLKTAELGHKIESEESYKKRFTQELESGNTAAMLAKVYFDCDNVYTKRNIPQTLETVNKLRKRISKKNPLYNKVLLKKAELLAAAPVVARNLKTVRSFANRILKDKNASADEKAQAKYLKEKKCYLENEDSDLDLFNMMWESSKNPDLPEASRIEAETYACIMVLNDCETELFSSEEEGSIAEEAIVEDEMTSESGSSVTEAEPRLTKERALERLETFLNYSDISIDLKAFIALQVVKEYRKERTPEKDQKAANILLKIINDPDVSETIRMEAALELVSMRFERRTKLINDDEAIHYVKQGKECKNLDEGLKMLFDFYFGKFCYEGRTKEIFDEDALILFETVEESELVHKFIQYEAMLYQVIMWYEGRAKLMTYEDAMQYLDKITDDPEALPCLIISKANLYKALILYKYEKDDKTAYRLFDIVANDELAEEKDRQTAKEHRDLMLNFERGLKYFDNPYGESY